MPYSIRNRRAAVPSRTHTVNDVYITWEKSTKSGVQSLYFDQRLNC